MREFDVSVQAELARLDVGSVRLDEPMAHHTTLHVGGPADAFVEPDTVEQLQRIVGFAGRHSLPFTVIGGGSNLLVSDLGIRGMVIRPGVGFDFIRFDSRQVTAGAAASLNRLVRESARRGLCGLEFAIGIPGNVGGAVYGNAGAAGGEVGAVLSLVRCLGADGSVREHGREAIGFGYRRSGLDGLVIFEATFDLADATFDVSARMKELLERRKHTQPVNHLNAGCIFKNAEAGPAGKLIDEMGGKGMRIGAAVVSDLHANFIINEGGATAAQVRELIQSVQARFREHYGFELQTEIRLMGEPDA